MKDYSVHPRKVVSSEHGEVLPEVALKRVEAGHRRVRAYAIAWGKLTQATPGSSRMSCYRVRKCDGLIQPQRVGHELPASAERRRQMSKAPDSFNAVLQRDFTDGVKRDVNPAKAPFSLELSLLGFGNTGSSLKK